MINKRNFFILIGLICCLIISIIFLFKELNRIKHQNEDLSGIITQNQASYISLLTQKEDSVQQLAISVKNLNDSLSKDNKDKKYLTAIISKLQLYIDTMHISGPSISINGKDSSGEYIQVIFSGKKGISAFSGYTRYYPATLSNKFDLWLSYDMIPIKSRLFYDTDNLWKIRTESLISNIKLKESYTIDSSIYIGLKSIVREKFEKAERALPLFGFRLKGNLGIKLSDVKQYQFNTVFFDGSAEAFYKNWNVTYYPFAKVISGGYNLTLDISSFFNKIF